MYKNMNVALFNILMYCNFLKKFELQKIQDKFKMSPDEAHDVYVYLIKNHYIIWIENNKYEVTYKCKRVLASVFLTWIFGNITAIAALIVSIIALFH